MAPSPNDFLEAKRLDVLAASILWGNAHFRTGDGLAYASDGRAYIPQNLAYAAALAEAVDEGRDVELEHGEALRRASGILERLLEGPARDARGLAFDSAGRLRRAEGGRSGRPLHPVTIRQSVVPILAFLELNRERLGLSRSAKDAVGHTLERLVAEHVVLEPTPRRPLPFARGPLPPPEPRPTRVSELLGALGRSFHWTLAATDVFPADPTESSIPTWRIPPQECHALQECTDARCWVRGSGQARPHIPCSMFKGDSKIPSGSAPPVIFVSGWQFQISPVGAGWPPTIDFTSHPSGLGFTAESSPSTRAPTWSPPPGEGKHDYPPPIVDIEPSIPQGISFCGLEQMLKCFAGYDHARFSQSHPGGDIEIAIDELYAVVDAVKSLFGADKVILVGHSRGGLVSRGYIVKRWQEDGVVDVHKLITYGTPHLGAQMADVGEEVIVEGLLYALQYLLFPFFPAGGILDLIGLIPGIGPGIKDELQGMIIDAVGPAIEPIWDALGEFLASGEEMKPTSEFLTGLNTAYAEQVVPADGRLVSLWDAIEHVLVAGTSPDMFTIYLGSWVSDFVNPLAALEPHVEMKRHKLFDKVYVWVPHVYWDFDWTWYPLLSVWSDIARAAQLADQPTPMQQPSIDELTALQDGRGDMIVERTSARADGVDGNIRRAEFKLNHFNIKANHEVRTIYQSPYGQQSVNPWQLLLLELGITSLGQITSCPCDLSCHVEGAQHVPQLP